MKRILRVFLAAALLTGAAACNPETYKNINYLQDISGDSPSGAAVSKGIIIQPQDQLSIIVNSPDPKLSFQFNKSIASYMAGSELGASGGQYIAGYSVDNDGDIIFPSLGTLHVAGLNRWELSELITARLKEEGLLEMLGTKIAIGQGHRGQTGPLGVGQCTSGYDCSISGCPAEEDKIYEELKAYILANPRVTEPDM